ncbi:ribonuclease T2 family protein [Dokdonella sp.]|uniref:ribonuclease T2 family protein n=1 Tax=Dokdonella sp. TaxID=2291710 RepID=UPI003C5D4663
MRTSTLALRATAALIVIAVLIWSSRENGSDSASVEQVQSASTATSGFDYYLIALSWSPTFCESNPDDREQCGTRGYGFILHGLWPQLEHGRGPRDCSSNLTPRRATVERTLSFMPSKRLIDHEWRAHGTCSGLDPEAYFELSDRAFASIRIPPALQPTARPGPMDAEDIRQAFVDANPALQTDMLGVSCKSGKFSEVRICVDMDLQPRRCGTGVGMHCPRNVPLRIPLAR